MQAYLNDHKSRISTTIAAHKATRLLCHAYSRTKAKPSTTTTTTTTSGGGLKDLLHSIFTKSLSSQVSLLLPTIHDLVQAVDLPVLLVPPGAQDRTLSDGVRASLLPLLLLQDDTPLALVADILAVANLTLRVMGFRAYFVEMVEGGEKRGGIGGVNVVLQATLRAYHKLSAGEWG